MDTFIANTNKLHEHYLGKVSTKGRQTKSINVLTSADEALMGIRGLQYLAYYLYRVWFKYLQLVLDSSDIVMGARNKVMGPILTYLDITSTERQSILKTLRPAPLVNRMPNNPNTLNDFINELHKQLADTAKYQELIEPSARHKLYKGMIEFIGKKGKLETVIEDITRLKLLMPGLGKPQS